MRLTLLVLLVLVLPACLAVGGSAESKDALAPSFVTLNGRVALKDALADVQKQTGNPVVDLRALQGQEAPNPELTLELAGISFWPALDQIGQQAGVRLFPYVDPKTRKAAVGIVGPDPATGKLPTLYAAYSGPFRFTVKRVAAVRDLEKESLSRLSVTLELACEPRFEPLLLRMVKDSVKFRAGDGPLKIAEQGGVGTIKLLGESPVELTLHLPLPPRGTGKLSELRCGFIALVHPERLSLDFGRLATGEKVVDRGVSVALGRVDVDARAGRTRIGVALEYPRGSLDLESHQTWAAEGHEMVLKSKAGSRELRPTGDPLISVEEGGPIRITYAFGEALTSANWSLVYRAPATPVRVPVGVSFKELPLQ